MALRFPCTSCRADIVVRWLSPGERALCRTCGERVLVPPHAESAADHDAQVELLGSPTGGRRPPARWMGATLPSSRLASAAPTPLRMAYAGIGLSLVLLLGAAGWVFFNEVEAGWHATAGLVRSPSFPDAPFATSEELTGYLLDHLRLDDDEQTHLAFLPGDPPLLLARSTGFDHWRIRKALEEMRARLPQEVLARLDMPPAHPGER